MLYVIEGADSKRHSVLLKNMFRDRKRVFIDFLKWDLTSTGDMEVDQFDGPYATYLVLQGAKGQHLGSVRLLASEGPHLLRSLFPELCEEGVPVGPDIFEITRLCFSVGLSQGETRAVRIRLASALVEYALATGITSYTGMTPIEFLSRMLTTGWRCDPLGLPQADGRSMIGAFQIHIDEQTPQLMRQAGNWRKSAIRIPSSIMRAAA